MASARLHFLFARQAPIGVIFRRGPSKQVRLVLWHTDTDAFEMGQWLKGTIYAERAALSPNGKLLAYFATDWRREPGNFDRLRRQTSTEENKDVAPAWIAVSRPPHLTALGLWFISWSTYGGEVFFADNHTLLLSDMAGEPAAGREPPRDFVAGKLPPNYDTLLERGWHPSPPVPASYEKPLPGGFAVLEYRCYDHSAVWQPASQTAYLEKFWLRSSRSDSEKAVCLNADYSEIDPSGRLILAQNGKLFVAVPNEDLSLTKTELADFNDMVFEPIAPPDWAKQWP